MGPLQRQQLLEDVVSLVNSGQWRFGDAVRFLRAVVLRLSRPAFAQRVGVSPAALQQLEEREDANPTLETMNRVLRPFGGALGFVFPRMTPPALTTVEREQRLIRLRTALNGTRRKRPVRGTSLNE